MIDLVLHDSYLKDVEEAASRVPSDALKGQIVVVTGSTGLIGSCVADVLLRIKRDREQSLNIILAGRNEGKIRDRFSQWDGSYQFANIDSLDEAANIPEADYYIHCAGNAHPAAYRDYPVETIMGNVMGTRAILEKIRSAKRGRILYLSSSEVYGKQSGNDPITEDSYGYVDILDSRSCYPSSKRLVETLCASYGTEYGVDYVIARPGHVYGPTYSPSDTRVHAEFARRAAAGLPIVLKSDGAQMRSYCYVTDCATALITIMTKGETGASYNISNRYSTISIRELARLFAEVGNVDLVFEVPSDSEKKAFNPMSTSELDAGRLESLGWQALVLPEEGVRRTLAGHCDDL